MEKLRPDTYLEKNPQAEGLTITEKGTAAHGADADEVVIALSPSFAESQTKTMTGIPHHDIHFL